MDAFLANAVPTREVFGNISPWMRLAFYALMLASMGFLAWRVAWRARLWWQGRPGGFERDWRVWIRRLAVYAAAQKRVHRKSLGAVLHILLFSGFVVLTIGTTLLAIADQGPVNFHQGTYYLLYELTMDVFGVALCVGCLLALYRRWAIRPASLGHQRSDWLVLAILLALGITGFLLEALRLRYTEVEPAIARWSVIGHLIDLTLLRGLDLETSRTWHLWMWWIHTLLVAGLFVAWPVTRFLHVLTGPLNLALRPERHPGALAPISIEEVEASGQTGVAQITDFNRQQLLSLDACMECGRCEDACPAWATGKPLSPKAVVVDLRAAMAAPNASPLHGGVIRPDTLWACTMCQACVHECPVLIGHVDLIGDLRRNLVGEGQIAGPPAKALSVTWRQFNPYGRPESDRMAWAAGLSVPTVESHPNADYLLWIGCAAAFDPRSQKVARALVQLLQRAGVSFAVLGKQERCTGDSARRLGDEFLFQFLARGNVETLNRHQVKKIITSCPHCLNTLKNEYPQFEGTYHVHHHSQLLAELLQSGRLSPGDTPSSDPVTLHDPCYLARVNGETEAQRTVLQAPSQPLREMPRCGSKTFCCGAGGGRMWFDDPPAQRVSTLRAAEAAATGAKTLATACPFCLNMMSDAVARGGPAEGMAVLDIAEILLQRQPPSHGLPPLPPAHP
ncbi:MAG: respiratory nitrate reductase subunit gamma [Verrucomicrobiae bacterium]|nr:respiratory nitrate reductase subunit gamma [Verrucomicrobiae bacterium]